MVIDEYLSWSYLIGELSKKISSAKGALKCIRPYILERTALQIHQALILLPFDYCSSAWGDCNLRWFDTYKLQKLQNRAASAITSSNYDTSASFLLNLLNWDDLITRRQKPKAILMFRTINGLTKSVPPEFIHSPQRAMQLKRLEAKCELPDMHKLWQAYFSL